MRLNHLPLAALVAGSSAQTMNITAALTSQPSLSTLTNLVSSNPQLLSTLSAAQNVTILAPSNDAFAAILNSSIITQNNTAAIQALLLYHVLNGVYPASAVKAMPAFLPTMLNNSQYDNVTGGQVVEAVTQGTSVEFYSGLLQNSTVTTAVSDVSDNGRSHLTTLRTRTLRAESSTSSIKS